MEMLKFTTVTKESFIGPHSVRAPSNTAPASTTSRLGTHSSGNSNPRDVVVVPELERSPKMLHSKQGLICS